MFTQLRHVFKKEVRRASFLFDILPTKEHLRHTVFEPQITWDTFKETQLYHQLLSRTCLQTLALLSGVFTPTEEVKSR